MNVPVYTHIHYSKYELSVQHLQWDRAWWVLLPKLEEVLLEVILVRFLPLAYRIRLCRKTGKYEIIYALRYNYILQKFKSTRNLVVNKYCSTFDFIKGLHCIKTK